MKREIYSCDRCQAEMSSAFLGHLAVSLSGPRLSATANSHAYRPLLEKAEVDLCHDCEEELMPKLRDLIAPARVTDYRIKEVAR